MKNTNLRQSVRSFVEMLDWVSFRKPPTILDYELSGVAQVWLYAVPVHSRPLLLSRRFPRIVNRLAACWTDAAALDDYLEDLLVDRRGNREGFPEGIREEILTLRSYALRERARATRPGSVSQAKA